MAEKPVQALVWIDQALSTSSVSMRLAAFHKKLERLDKQNQFVDYLSHCRPIIEQSADCWSPELVATAPNLTPEQSDLLILIRGLLEAMQQVDAPASAWRELRILAGDLLGGQLQVELIRDPKQPAEWFESQKESDVAEPRPERVGLALRTAGQAWFCFPKGQVRVPLLWPQVQDTAGRHDCAAVASDWPKPAGFAELLEFASHQDVIGCETYRERLLAWPDAALSGTLEMTAVQFFVDFWGELGEKLRNHDAKSAQELSNRLVSVLRQNWKLYPFYPAAYQDYPDGWLQRTPGRNMVTGRVRRLLRPGLQDDDGHLRVPALVEVE